MSRPAGLHPPPTAAGAPVDEQVVSLAVELIDRSGVAERAEAGLVTTVGRHRSVSVTAVLVALLILAITDRPLLLTGVTRLLHQRITPATRQRLGVTRGPPVDRAQFQARYRCVRYTFGLLCSAMDPSPLPKNRRLAADQLKAATRAITDTDRDTARDRLEAFANALLDASLSVLSDQEYHAWDGSVGLDATPVPLFSRGPSARSDKCASDPDGGWYVRNHRDSREDAPTAGRRGTLKVRWALEATIATMAAPPGQAAEICKLAVGFVLERPSVDPGGTGVRVLRSIRARGHRPGWLGADRAYTTALPEVFHLPAAALGYRLVMDYKNDQLGTQATSSGALLVDGSWYCPAIPASLITAVADHRDQRIDDHLLTDRIAARGDYRLRPKDGPDADGYLRLSCPALGEHPKLACPLREDSQRDHARTPVLAPPAQPPKICTQTAITIGPHIGARHRQQLRYGTTDWARTYATLRNTIEGLNGYLKDPAHEALDQPGRRRVRGITAQTIICAVLLTAANLRKIRAHRAAVADNNAQTITRRARRRRTSLAEHLPDG